MWLIQLLRSTYGIKQHCIAPTPFQHDMDQYWIQRRKTAAVLLHSYDEIEAVVEV